MRFRNYSLEKTILILSLLFVINLGLNDELGLYIHPRYTVFTVTFSVIGLVAMVFARRGKRHSGEHGSRVQLLAVSFVLLGAFILPSRTLTSATISQRKIDSGSLTSSVSSGATSPLFSGSSKSLKLFDWARLIQINKEESYYVNKPAVVRGFIYDADLGEDVVWLANFVVTCCAVDAQPVGVPVQINDWQVHYDEDQWLQIEGEFVQNNSTVIELKPSSIVEIERPKNPYEG